MGEGECGGGQGQEFLGPTCQLRVVPAHPGGSWAAWEVKGRVSTAPCAPHNFSILLYRLSNKGTLHATQEERESKRAEGHGGSQSQPQITWLSASDLLVSASSFLLSALITANPTPPHPLGLPITVAGIAQDTVPRHQVSMLTTNGGGPPTLG